jgi:hypothetical protein
VRTSRDLEIPNMDRRDFIKRASAALAVVAGRDVGLLIPNDAGAFASLSPRSPKLITKWPHVTRFVYVGEAGDVCVRFFNDQEITFRDVPAGAILPIKAKGINLEKTTAAEIAAMGDPT